MSGFLSNVKTAKLSIKLRKLEVWNFVMHSKMFSKSQRFLQRFFLASIFQFKNRSKIDRETLQENRKVNSIRFKLAVQFIMQ